MSQPVTPSAPAPSLWNRNFSLLFGGQAISELLSVCYSFTMLLWLEKTFDSLALAGYMTAIIGLASLFGGLIGGTAADRSDGRGLLIGLDCARGSLLLAFFVIFTSRDFDATLLGALYVCIGALLGLGSGSAGAIAGALIPRWVPLHALPKAIGWAQFAFHGAGVIGRGIAGFCFISLGTATIILANGLSFLAAAICLLPTSKAVKKIPTDPKPSFMRDFFRGFSVVWRNASFRDTVLTCCTVNFFTAPLPLLLVFSLDEGKQTPATFGLQMLCLSLGGLLGNSLFSRFHHHLGYRLAGICLSLLALPFLGLTHSPIWLQFGCLFGLGLFAALFNASTYCFLQEHSSDHERGRVLGIYSALSALMVPVGLAFSASISQFQHFTTQRFFLITTCALLIAGLHLLRRHWTHRF